VKTAESSGSHGLFMFIQKIGKHKKCRRKNFLKEFSQM
jgi:hypothetical protein